MVFIITIILGEGEVCLDELQFEVVDNTVPLTDPVFPDPGTMIFCDSQNTAEFPLNASNYRIGIIHRRLSQNL